MPNRDARILIVATDGFEQLELTVPGDELRKKGARTGGPASGRPRGGLKSSGPAWRILLLNQQPLELAVSHTVREKTKLLRRAVLSQMKLPATLLCLCVFGSAGAAAVECAPHCDYYHYYGPYDFTYARPDLYAYPVCGPRGECSPYLVYSTSGVRRGRIEIRFPRRRAPRAWRRTGHIGEMNFLPRGASADG